MTEDRPRLTTELRLAPTKYEAKSRIAVGGMAEVWKADAIFASERRHPVAIKRAIAKLEHDPIYRSMFEDEARLGMLLRHPNIVRVYDAREIRGTFIMIMELVDGASFRSMLESAHERGAGMPIASALYIAREIAKALEYAHSARDAEDRPLNIIHRDVSPHNVLLAKSGAVKLTDFGLANASTHLTQIDSGLVGGKLGYLAPEIIEQRASTPAIDVFALGIVLWEALAGRRLFHSEDDGETVRNIVRCEVPPAAEFNVQVPPEVDALLAQTLERDPARRVPSARALREKLDALIELVDPRVGAGDIALLVGLYLAGMRIRTLPPSDVTRIVEDDLALFIQAAAGTDYVLD